MLNVAPRTVARAKKVRDKGTPELVAKVEAGEIAVSTAAKIAELPVDTQREIVAHVRPDTAVKKVARALKEVALATKTITASTRGVDPVFGVVYADPPWRFEVRSENGLDRSADNHYPTMSLDEIRSLKVPAAADAVLFLWATVPMLPEALDVMTAWGFSYKSHIAWVKDRTGTGYWARNRHELLLIGTKGEIPAPALGDQPASVIEAPLGKHSAKPACFAELIERLFPMTPKVELFCRLPREGWVALGNEADAA
jgi:N6-adenosine-specific RNA methylase IME4